MPQRLKVGDEEYRVGFLYERPPPGAYFPPDTPEGLPYHARTTCTILRGEDVLATGVARCSLLDNHERAAGRKVALKRALETLWPERCAQRTAFWAAFWVLTGREWNTRRGTRRGRKRAAGAPAGV